MSLSSSNDKVKHMPPRIIIYPKDVENITGRSGRTCRDILRKIRTRINKEPGEMVTIVEFCEYMKIPRSLVEPFLFD